MEPKNPSKKKLMKDIREVLRLYVALENPKNLHNPDEISDRAILEHFSMLQKEERKKEHISWKENPSPFIIEGEWKDFSPELTYGDLIKW